MSFTFNKTLVRFKGTAVDCDRLVKHYRGTEETLIISVAVGQTFVSAVLRELAMNFLAWRHVI